MSGPARVLYLDVGNTRAHWRYCGENANCAVADTMLRVKSFLEQHPTVVDIVAASVGHPGIIDALMDYAVGTGRSVIVARPDGQLPSMYANGQLGLDRWLACLAVGAREPTASHIVVDAGTAVTIDVVNGKEHQGGWILPGCRRWRDSLLAGTQIPAHERVSGVNQFGNNTAGAIANGWLAATQGAVQVAQKMVAGQPNVWVTGGDGPLLTPFMPYAHYEVNLVLDGLAAWYMSAQAGAQ